MLWLKIGGQCWARYNSDVVNSNDQPAVNNGVDRGSSDYYNSAASEPAANEGLLYQWSAAMNAATAERAQGVCPTGWHVPSDCEWMFLENSLGMSTADQINTGNRTSGLVGGKLKGSTGFAALSAGLGLNYIDRGIHAFFWSSSVYNGSVHFSRAMFINDSYMYRNNNKDDSYSFSVRCLKD